MSKRLVAYFSASGVTAKLAKALAEAADADLFSCCYGIYKQDKFLLRWRKIKTDRSSIWL